MRNISTEKVRQKIIPALVLALIIAIMVLLFMYGRDPETLERLQRYRYLGAFLISLVGNASVLLPGVVLPALTALGIDFYRIYGLVSGPLIIGVLGGIGAALGETVGYAAGYSGRTLVRGNQRYDRIQQWLKRWGGLGVFIFSLLPLFFDLVGLAAGALRFPVWKFLIFCWAGRTVLYTTIITLAAIGYGSLVPLFS